MQFLTFNYLLDSLFASKTAPVSSFCGGSGQFSNRLANVVKSGFGDIQSANNAGSFGSAPAFGSPPAFGGQPSFGGGPNFGGSSTFSRSVPNANAPIFGSSTSSAGFGALASNSAPSFGNLAQQGATFDSSKPT